MTEVKQPEVLTKEETPSQKHEPLISRRGFLRMLGTGAKLTTLDSILSHIPGVPSLSKDFWQQLETATLGVPPEDLQREIEARFDIEIVSPSTGVRELGGISDETLSTVEWDSARLKKLIEYLAELPSNFYAPRKTENGDRKLRVALVDQPIVDFRKGKYSLALPSFCECSKDEDRPTVVLDRKMTGATAIELLLAREVVIHEFTHAVTTPEIDSYIQSITKPIGLDDIPELRKAFSSITLVTSKGNPHMTPQAEGANFLDQIPGKFVEIAPDIYVDKRSLRQMGVEYFLSGGGIEDQLVRVTPEWYVGRKNLDKYGKAFYEQQYKEYLIKAKDWEKYGGDLLAGVIPGIDATYLSYGATNFQEFFSVAATFYLRGHDRFVGTYEPYLGKERAEKLYEGIKREIFKEIEY